MLEQWDDSIEPEGDWTKDPVTTWGGQGYLATFLDQYGNPMADTDFDDDNVYFNSDVAGEDWIGYDLGTTDADGQYEFGTGLWSGNLTVTVWIDEDERQRHRRGRAQVELRGHHHPLHGLS